MGGLKAMYMFDVELQDLSSKPEWYQDSIRVLSGDFTDPNDRRKLVPIILGLWASCLRNRHDGVCATRRTAAQYSSRLVVLPC